VVKVDNSHSCSTSCYQKETKILWKKNLIIYRPFVKLSFNDFVFFSKKMKEMCSSWINKLLELEAFFKVTLMRSQ